MAELNWKRFCADTSKPPLCRVLATASDWRRFPHGALLICSLLVTHLVNQASPVLGAPLQVFLVQHEGANKQVVVTNTVPGKSYYVMASSDLGKADWKVVGPFPLVARTNYCEFDVTNNLNSGFFRALELDPAVAVTSDKVTTQDWLTSDSWVPITLSCIITNNAQTLITLGSWWYGNGDGGGVMPTDSKGTFSAAMNAGYPTGEAPLVVQVAYQTSPNVALHVVQPGVIGGSGDGYFVLVVANGIATNSPVLDVGHARIWHTAVGPNDPNSIQSISVVTDGRGARVGDLAVAIIGQDSYGANNQMSLPSGWTSLGVGNDATNNICYRACYKIVTAPGRQSITCNWVSTSCFVAEAAIVIFGRQ